ncbi:HtjA [Salmonella phage FSL SP-126]|uniref:HtjA n=1 Tax=Salmonella phage FSL SP-126 TaxID=2928681 RepID=S4TS71_9CAUD|nr:HtjA [Salmonella phage FSL SP-126]AGF87855.1 HtjA [Salmonella phage FSL SP-126]
MSDYGSIIGIVENGCLVDSSLYNIDGSPVMDVSAVIGKAVCVDRISCGYKIISHNFNENSKHYGIVTRDYMDFCKEYYDAGDPVNVITHGRIWVITQDEQDIPSYKDPVFVKDNGSISTSGFPTSWFFTGEYVRYSQGYILLSVQL